MTGGIVDRRTFIFGVIMLLLMPVLWPVAMLMPSRRKSQARMLERETECRRLIVAACERGDVEKATELAALWTGINADASGPREIGIVLQSTLSRDRKLEHIARIAVRGMEGGP